MNSSASSGIDEQRLAEILRRVELGDTSVTDEVFWLQLHEDFVTARRQPRPAESN